VADLPPSPHVHVANQLAGQLLTCYRSRSSSCHKGRIRVKLYFNIFLLSPRFPNYHEVPGYEYHFLNWLLPHGPFVEVEVEVEVNLRPTVSRPVYLGVRRPSGTHDQFFFSLEISFRQLRVSYFVAPSPTRGRVCNLLYNCFWALPEQSLLGWSPAELTAIFYCLIWDSPNLEGQVPVFISSRNRVAQYPRTLGSFFVASYDSQGSGGGILTRLHTGSPFDGVCLSLWRYLQTNIFYTEPSTLT
jgi:hypothetical protein